MVFSGNFLHVSYWPKCYARQECCISELQDILVVIHSLLLEIQILKSKHICRFLFLQWLQLHPAPTPWSLTFQCFLSFLFFSFFFFLRFYLFIPERHRERQTYRGKEKQAPCREPDVGLGTRTPGSRPEPKADAQPLSHSGIPF